MTEAEKLKMFVVEQLLHIARFNEDARLRFDALVLLNKIADAMLKEKQ